MSIFKFIVLETQENVDFIYWYHISGNVIIPIIGDLNFVLLKNGDVFNSEVMSYDNLTETYYVKLLDKDIEMSNISKKVHRRFV